jgi:hypothetical protein
VSGRRSGAGHPAALKVVNAPSSGECGELHPESASFTLKIPGGFR